MSLEGADTVALHLHGQVGGGQQHVPPARIVDVAIVVFAAHDIDDAAVGVESCRRHIDPQRQHPLPDLNSLPDDLKAKILEVQEKAGFVPNVFLALARRPAEWRAFFAYHDALMVPESVGRTSGLTKGDREMIVTTTSAANHCLYCVVAHGAILRIYEKKPLLADQLAVNHRKADITPRQRAMLDFAMKVCTASHTLEESDHDALRAHGFSDDDIWDIGAITAFFGLSNRLANLSAMRPNDEFFLMGRVPRAK